MEKLNLALEKYNDSHSESDAISFCLALLEYSGVIPSYGYVITTQEYYSERIYDMIVKVSIGEEVIFVMEQKSDSSSPLEHERKGLVKCMKSLGCGDGFLVSPQSIFHFNDFFLGYVGEVRKIDNKNISDVVGMIREVAGL